MRITFVLPDIGVCGGVKAVFEFANYLHKRGHEVWVAYPLILAYPARTTFYNIRHFGRKMEEALGRIKHAFSRRWFDLKANLIRVPVLAERYIPDADIVVATSWPTAYCVSKYSASKGEKFYLVQHYETWDGPEKLVNDSYRLGLRIIVNSTWLKNILEDKLGIEVEELIPHSPDPAFYPENRERAGRVLRILMPHRKGEWKGVADGIAAFKRAKKECPNIHLVMFGLGGGSDVPEWVEFHKNPCQDELRKIYNSCDIFLFPSWHEGFGMPPMEAMACKRAVVTTNVGAVSDYAIADKTAIICPPRSPELLAKGIIKLIKNRRLLNQISEAGYNYIVKNFSWERSTRALERTFKKALVKKTAKGDYG